MRRIIRASLLTLAMCCAANAGEIPNDLRASGEIPNDIHVVGDIQNGVTGTSQQLAAEFTTTEAVLSLLQSVLTLF